MLTKKSKSILKMLAFTSLVLPNIAWSAGESCNYLLNLGIYNVTQSSGASDGQAMGMSTFCSADYSSSSLSTSQSASIEASYGLFSGGAGGSASRQDIITRQSQVCKGDFNSSHYSTNASDYSKTVYQGSLDAWNKCQELANKGLVFSVQPSSISQGVSVSITAPTGFSAIFYGVAQYGSGQSSCVTMANGKVLNVSTSKPFRFTAASKVTVSCTRQMDATGQDLTADAQDLVFVTSADNLTVPLAAIGSLSRVTVDQIKAGITASINQAVSPISSRLNELSTTTKISQTLEYQGKNVNWRKMIYCHFPGVDIMLRPEAFDCPVNYIKDDSFGSFSILVD